MVNAMKSQIKLRVFMSEGFANILFSFRSEGDILLRFIHSCYARHF